MAETQGGDQPRGRFPPPPGPGPVERPAPVRRSAIAWWGATACWFLGSVLGQVLGGHVVVSIRFPPSRTAGTGDGTELGRTAQSAVPTPVAVLVFVVLAGLWALLVLGMHRGANRARIALAVVGAPGVLNLVLQLVATLTATGQNGGDVVRGVFFLAALGSAMAGFVLMFRADARPFFARRPRAAASP